jgi:hypothetical protein
MFRRGIDWNVMVPTMERLAMSALGQKQTLDWRPMMSAIHPKADIAGRDQDVRFRT